MATNSIFIDAPVDQVFEYVADLTRHGEWAGHRLSVEPEGTETAAVGARYLSHGVQFGQSINDTLTLTEYEPGRRFVFESAGRGGVWRHAYEFEPLDRGTKLTRRMEPARLLLPLKLLSSLFGFGLRRRNQKDLDRLKAVLESGKAG